jgi:hypothetical protein
MQTCPSCGNELSERAVFCGSCTKQARCRACRDILELNAKACVSCGTVVGEGQRTNGSSTVQPTLHMNTFLLKETTNSRTVEVSFSDAAVVNLGDVLGYVGSTRIGKRRPLTRTDELNDSQLLLPGTAEIGNEGDLSEADKSVATAKPGSQTAAELDKERLREIFAQDAERLVLDNLRLKATSQLDASRRLVYLFLYAHEVEGHQQVSREAINTVLKDVGLYEPNIVSWISTSSDLRESAEDGQPMFRLRKTGRDEAKRVLGEVHNPEVVDAWTLSDRSRARGKSTNDAGSSEKAGATRGRKKSAKPDDWATKWASLSAGIDGHSIVDGANGLNKGLFGLWAIRRATEDNAKVVSKSHLASFIHKAFVVKVAPSTLQTALESKNAKGKVIRVKGGYEITPTGMNDAAALSGATKSQAAAAGKGLIKK